MTNPTSGGEPRNLVLINHPGRQDWRDFEAIGREIFRLAPEISGYILTPNRTAEFISRKAWQRPSLIVSFGGLGRFVPPRGRVFKSAWIPKYDEYQLFLAAGVRSPFTSVFDPDRPFDFSKHQSLVVAKPTKMGSMSYGNQVVLMRRERVEKVVPMRFAPELIAKEAPVIVQDFVETGPTPVHYRVLLLFGEPLFCFRARSTEKIVPQDAPDAELERALVATNSDQRTIEFVSDSEVVEFAKQAARAISWIPLLGVDVIRERGTGYLYALETNPGGNTWAFSSRIGEAARNLVGGSGPFINQFGAWNIAARTLIRATHCFAE